MICDPSSIVSLDQFSCLLSPDVSLDESDLIRYHLISSHQPERARTRGIFLPHTHTLPPSYLALLSSAAHALLCGAAACSAHSFNGMHTPAVLSWGPLLSFSGRMAAGMGVTVHGSPASLPPACLPTLGGGCWRKEEGRPDDGQTGGRTARLTLFCIFSNFPRWVAFSL